MRSTNCIAVLKSRNLNVRCSLSSRSSQAGTSRRSAVAPAVSSFGTPPSQGTQCLARRSIPPPFRPEPSATRAGGHLRVERRQSIARRRLAALAERPLARFGAEHAGRRRRQHFQPLDGDRLVAILAG